eukprot:1161671-Pelagomonas_calceolata.AAC.19
MQEVEVSIQQLKTTEAAACRVWPPLAAADPFMTVPVRNAPIPICCSWRTKVAPASAVRWLAPPSAPCLSIALPVQVTGCGQAGRQHSSIHPSHLHAGLVAGASGKGVQQGNYVLGISRRDGKGRRGRANLVKATITAVGGASGGGGWGRKFFNCARGWNRHAAAVSGARGGGGWGHQLCARGWKRHGGAPVSRQAGLRLCSVCHGGLVPLLMVTETVLQQWGDCTRNLLDQLGVIVAEGDERPHDRGHIFQPAQIHTHM